MSTPTHSDRDDSDDAPDRKDRKDRYNETLRVVDYQTSGDQPTGVREEIVVANRVRAGYSPDGIHSTLRAAVDNGDLLRWTGAEGRTRYAQPSAAAVRAILAAAGEPVTHESVVALIEHEADRADPNHDRVAAANQLLAELEGGD
jgi:hypothetical protein